MIPGGEPGDFQRILGGRVFLAVHRHAVAADPARIVVGDAPCEVPARFVGHGSLGTEPRHPIRRAVVGDLESRGGGLADVPGGVVRDHRNAVLADRKIADHGLRVGGDQPRRAAFDEVVIDPDVVVGVEGERGGPADDVHRNFAHHGRRDIRHFKGADIAPRRRRGARFDRPHLTLVLAGGDAGEAQRGFARGVEPTVVQYLVAGGFAEVTPRKNRFVAGVGGGGENIAGVGHGIFLSCKRSENDFPGLT